jgi:5-methylcytosine-specific restriction endonuclease McrA
VTCWCGKPLAPRTRVSGRRTQRCTEHLGKATPEQRRRIVRKWREANRELENSRAKERRASDPEKTRERNRRYRITHRENVLAAHRRYKAANPNKDRAYYLANRDSLCEKTREKHKNNPAVRRQAALRWAKKNHEKHMEAVKRYKNTAKGKASSRRGASKRRAAKTNTRGDEVSLSFIGLLLSETHCAYCLQITAPAQREIEHVQPLSKGGTHTEDNLVMACTHCNRTKHATDALTWLTKRAT